MPTSSQAMILRSNDIETPRTSVSSRSLAPAVCHPIFDTCSPPKACIKFTKGSPNGSPSTRDSMEVVKFDVTLSATPQAMTMNGFEGTFSFDPIKKAYKWQICTVGSPKLEDNAPQNSPTPEAGDSIQVKPEFESEKNSLEPKEPHPSPRTSEHTLPSENTPSASTSSSESSIHEEIGNPSAQKSRSRSLSPEIDDGLYRRLEELGFRRRSGYTPGGCLRRLRKGERRFVTVDEKGSTPVQPPRAKMIKLPVSSEDENILYPVPISTGVSPYRQKSTPKKRQPLHKRGISLLDEIKDKVQWDKRILPSSHVQLDANVRSWSTCFNVPRDADFSHADIKRIVESQTGCKIRCIQFDPVTVRTSDPEAEDRWIITFADKHDFIFSIQKGLTVNGSKIDVKSWEDVAAQERQSYKEFQNWYVATRPKINPDKNPVIKQFLDTNWSADKSHV